ncbi:MFS transporter [Nocardioides caldifontis]|uniref:MFS transporter n=1 Tax=Nocardioides caldifontis TaxID=2588938 RepID=UPI001939C550|nr:MFS transporter [Nocardioides caldifontis]
MVDTAPASSSPAVEHPWRALTVTLLVGFMSLLDVTIVNVAVPSIEKGLGASPETVQWVVSGYALTFGLTLVAGGRLGDVVGRRRMFLIGLAGFTLTSALAGAAWDGPSIVVARLLQGACAGLLTPQNTGLIQQLFTGADRGRAFGYFGTTVGVSAASGPLIGGLLIEAFGPDDGWRWVFLVNVPIGVVGMVMATRLLPRQRPTGARNVARQVDVPGALLLGAVTLSLLLPVVETQASPDPRWWLLLLLTPVATWLFLRRERRLLAQDGAPLLDVRLFTEVPGFASGIALGSVYFCGFAGIWLVLALFFQGELGYSALQSGLSVMPFAIGSAATSVVAGRLVARHGRRVTVTGLSLVVVGFVSLAVVLPLVSPDRVALWAALPLLVAGIGSGATISPNFTLTLAEVPPRMGGAAGGAVQTGQRIGTAVGAALLAAAYRVTLERSGAETATAVTFTTSAVFAVVALVIAVRELRLHPFGSESLDRSPAASG